MSIEEEIERIGGLLPIGSAEFNPLKRADIESMLPSALASSLPSDYVEFVTRYGSCGTRHETYLDLPSTFAEYVHPAETEMPNPVHNKIGLAHFYGADQDTRTLSLRWAIKTYQNRLPEGFVPIADDGAGNQLCWGPSIDREPSIHWWDHENEWDAEDYEDDTGYPMPPEAKYQNVYFIAPSFDELFRMLKTLD